MYRHELKYRISYAEKAALELRLAPLLRRDAHAKPGGYRIRSLYFDDWWNSAYGEKEAGVFLRKSTASASTTAAMPSLSWSGKEGGQLHL